MTNKERLQAIKRVLKKIVKYPTSILLVLKDETEHKIYLRKKYGRTQFPTANINDFLKNNEAIVTNYTFLDGSSLITDLALLKSIAATFPDCEYLEIGTWRGESIINVSECAKNCTSINLSPEDLCSLGLPEKYASLHGCLIKNQKNISFVYANSLTFDFSSLNKKFDLIFVDGDHSYNAVKSDTENVFKLLKNDNSIIVWHDYAYTPETPRHSVISAILDGLPSSAHSYLYHVSNTICAVYTKRDLITEIQDAIVTPDKVFKIHIETNAFNI